MFSPMCLFLNVEVMYDAFTKLGELSGMLQMRGMMLPEADKLTAWQIHDS